MRKFFAKSLQYFLMIQVSILIAMMLSLLLVIPIRFLFENEMIQSVLFAIIGLILEMIIITFLFFKEKIDFKNSTLKNFLSPCIFAIVFHTIISYFNGFYMYIAGISVSEIGIAWQSSATNNIVSDMREVEMFRLIIPFIIMVICRVISVFLGYYFGKKKIIKSKRKFNH